MELIKWKSEYSVNVQEIDDQHRDLIGIINRLGDAMSVGRGRDVLDGLLAELMNYTEYHFAAEERLFRLHAYSREVEHRKAHAELAVKAKELKDAADREGRRSSVDVMLLLSSWLDKHILQEDRKFGAYLNEQGVAARGERERERRE